MVAHLWAHQKQDFATNGSNFYFQGKEIYSYGPHFRCASVETNKFGHKAYLVTTRTYSNTTAKHMGMVRNAIPCGELVFNTPRVVSLHGGKLSKVDYYEASEYDHIMTYACDELYLKYLLYHHGIVERWRSEAKQAITQLEALCGQTFKDESVRYQIDPLSDEERTLIESRIAEGYYTKAAIAKRKREAAQTARRKEIERLKRRAQDAKRKNDQELQVKLYLFRLGAPLESFIYYDHSKEVEFNWTRRINERERMSEKQYNELMAKIDRNKLPEGITFKFKPAF